MMPARKSSRGLSVWLRWPWRNLMKRHRTAGRRTQGCHGQQPSCSSVWKQGCPAHCQQRKPLLISTKAYKGGSNVGRTPIKRKSKKAGALAVTPLTLYNELAAWAEDEFRSVNGQIEYLLTECVKYRKTSFKNRSPALLNK